MPCLMCLQFHNGYFVDLFVRKSNDVAVGMYRKLGYVVYREEKGAAAAVPVAADPAPVSPDPPADLFCTTCKFPGVTCTHAEVSMG
eukprot:1158278-Pelagomonas_calceolata.AAC.4